MNRLKNAFVTLACLISLLGLSACQTHTQQGALMGGLGGAAIGGIAGGKKGALIGGAAGAATGAVIGKKKDNKYGDRY